MPDEELLAVRVDRWLWATRIFKTRTLATEACQRNQVKLGGKPIKPSRNIKAGDILSIKLGPLLKEIKVVRLTEKRVSASLAKMLLSDLTSDEAYQEAREKKAQIKPTISLKRGMGRPTKKQRRQLDEFLYPE